MTTKTAARVNEQRQWDRLMAMARIGAIPGNGVNRACLTELDRQARRLLIGWAKEIGVTVSVDAAANLWLRREGSESGATAVVTGSHMDTQPNGGRFDGIYGVIAGLEALTALHDAGATPRRPMEVVAWTNEEGGRFAPGCMGSMAWSSFRGLEEFADVLDPDGIRFGDALAAHLTAEADLPHRRSRQRTARLCRGAYRAGTAARSGTAGYRRGHRHPGQPLVHGNPTGDTAHAGTTPLALRRDAVQDMLRAISALNVLMHDPHDVLRFTVGRIAVEPNTSNSVANRASFTIDFRHPEKAVLLARGDAVAGVVQAAVRDCSVTVQETFHALPVEFSPLVIDAVEAAATRQRYRQLRLPSGAFHDAQFVVPVCPTGMIFVPCHKGISHNPAEFSEPGQLAAGTQVLTQALLDLANG